ncbi:MAG: hypothetical protein A3D31_11405 [Candidatus Fluviicola riflensis]|nr:MAG: hypothetical protein CHH17_15830 [Candidatus Fluviicola riflensis]OGS77596.1 MAG: hypothetical protein A3D31_11405 [Candidatus Fluviicola riflensis]OGS84178.1 MAG: hypothetical protein A3E30_12810 [Fluviicola sp. RIFCSPHIGHO2_12_FULL_43_24]OGS84662.1 MAG: hypothetical protein A2724_08340 [Fluviicola sp. RIFCSPHIGHO2_01_FULL_43_53]
MKTFRVLLILTIVSTTISSILVFQNQNEKPCFKDASKYKTIQNVKVKSVSLETKYLKNVQNQE